MCTCVCTILQLVFAPSFCPPLSFYVSPCSSLTFLRTGQKYLRIQASMGFLCEGSTDQAVSHFTDGYMELHRGCLPFSESGTRWHSHVAKTATPWALRQASLPWYQPITACFLKHKLKWSLLNRLSCANHRLILQVAAKRDTQIIIKPQGMVIHPCKN